MNYALFNLDVDLRAILEELEEGLGEITPEIADKLAINREGLERQVIGYHKVMLQLDGDIEVCDTEIKRLYQIIEQKAKQREAFKKILFEATKAFGYEGKSGNKKLDFPTLKLFTKKFESVEILNADLVTDERVITYIVTNPLDTKTYKKVLEKFDDLQIIVKPQKLISKTELKPLLKDGEVIEGVKLNQNETVVIK